MKVSRNFVMVMKIIGEDLNSTSYKFKKGHLCANLFCDYKFC